MMLNVDYRGKKKKVKVLHWRWTLEYIRNPNQRRKVSAWKKYHPSGSENGKYLHDRRWKSQNRRPWNVQNYVQRWPTDLYQSGNAYIFCSWDHSKQALLLPSWYLVIRLHFLLLGNAGASFSRCNHLNASLLRHRQKS